MTAKKASEPKTVTLIDPDGNAHEAATPIEVNTLVFGSGYRVQSGKSVDAAVAEMSFTGDATPVVVTETTKS